MESFGVKGITGLGAFADLAMAAAVFMVGLQFTLRTVMAAKGIPNPVLSFEEIGIDARPALVGVVAA